MLHGDCWVWVASGSPNGYGQISWQGKTTLSHRLAYRLLIGPIPQGLTLDHLCRNRRCVNPGHLEPVTGLENVRRGHAGKRERERTHCAKGHPYNLTNTYWYGRKRQCLICRTAMNRKKSAERSALRRVNV